MRAISSRVRVGSRLVSEERSRPQPSASRTASHPEPIRERTYGEDEVAAILKRAARIDHDQGSTQGALSLREIEAIARDAGIDPSLVRQVAREIDEERERGLGGALAGAPVRATIERVVDGEIGAEDHERLAQEIRGVLSSAGVGNRWGLPGSISSIGRTLTVAGFTGTSSIEMTIAPRDGKTFIRLTSDRGQLAGGLFGGIVGGVGGGVGSNVGWMLPALLHLPWFVGVAGAGAVVFGAYWLARSIFVSNARGLDRKMEALADRLETIAASATSARSLPSGGP
jgi:hypothetical protein